MVEYLYTKSTSKAKSTMPPEKQAGGTKAKAPIPLCGIGVPGRRQMREDSQEWLSHEKQLAAARSKAAPVIQSGGRPLRLCGRRGRLAARRLLLRRRAGLRLRLPPGLH